MTPITTIKKPKAKRYNDKFERAFNKLGVSAADVASVTHATIDGDYKFLLAWERASHAFLNSPAATELTDDLCVREHSLLLVLKNAYKLGLEVGFQLGKLAKKA